jgi:DNA-binding transcriptional ArsR family regulator
MKRDMDLVRKISLEIESCGDPYGLDEIPEIDGFDPETISYHIKLMRDAGLVEADESNYLGVSHAHFSGINLTWDGHEFLKVACDDSIWEKAKQYILKPGVAFTFDILKDWLKAKALEKIGPF